MRGLFLRRVISSQRFNHRVSYLQRRPFCNNNNNKKPPNNEIVNADPKFDPYKEVYNLDFEKATKILMSDRQRERKFGLDFHLVQLFFTCLPSLAVYLVVLYSRREKRKWEEAREKKKKAEEDAKAKEKMLELVAAGEAVAANPALVEVKVRLDKLEETIKDLVVDSKKESNNLEDKSKLEKSKQEPTPTKPSNSPDNNHSSNTATTKTSSNTEGDASKGSLESQSDGSTKPSNSPDNNHSSNTATTKTSSNTEGDASKGSPESQSDGSSSKKI